MTNSKSKNFLLFIGIIWLLWLISVPFYSGDIKNHVEWAKSLSYLGPLGFYERSFDKFAFPNYPPFAMWTFAASYLLYQFKLSSIYFINQLIQSFPSNLVFFFEWENTYISFLKLPAIISATAISYLIYLLTKKKLAALIFILNPAVIYLTSIWGQIDLLPIVFIMLAIYLYVRNKSFLFFLSLILSLLSKQTVLIFMPLFFYLSFKKWGFKQLLLGFGIMVLTFYFAYLPFHQFSLTWAYELYRLNFSLVAFSTNENAINFWGFLSNFQTESDLNSFLGITLQSWGYLLFAFNFLIILIIFLKKKIILKNILQALLLITLLYFFFLTRMHERYLISAIVFLTILTFWDKRYLISLIFFSLLHFINLYRGLFEPKSVLLASTVNNLLVLQILVFGYAIMIIYNYYLYLNDE